MNNYPVMIIEQNFLFPRVEALAFAFHPMNARGKIIDTSYLLLEMQYYHGKLVMHEYLVRNDRSVLGSFSWNTCRSRFRNARAFSLLLENTLALNVTLMEICDSNDSLRRRCVKMEDKQETGFKMISRLTQSIRNQSLHSWRTIETQLLSINWIVTERYLDWDFNLDVIFIFVMLRQHWDICFSKLQKFIPSHKRQITDFQMS